MLAQQKALSWATLVPLVALCVVVGLVLRPHSRADQVDGVNYEICNEGSQYLTSPWTYDALASGSQSYTVAQYEALSGYGTTLPPLPSYISSQDSTTEAAVIYAPGSTVNEPAYNFPNTPIVSFFEGGAYNDIGFDSVSGDQFIGGSAAGYPEPAFDDGGNAEGIDGQNATFDFSGGASTLTATANSGATTITTADAIPGYIADLTFTDGSTYPIGNVSGTTITLDSPLTSSESAGSAVWANRQAPIGKVASGASQGATSVTLDSSALPLVQYGNIRIGADNYTLSSVSGNQSGYTVGVPGLDTALAAGTPIYYDGMAGDVTVSYLNINNDQHTTTGTIYTGSGWTITHDNIHDGYSKGPGYGVALYGGDEGTIEYNCLSKMGDYGENIFGTGSKFDYNEVYESNYQPDPGCGCSGGGKWWGTLNSDIVDNAFVNDGIGDSGFAIWLDNGNTGTLISGNFFNQTAGPAISSETGFNLDITDNLFENDNWGTGDGCGNSNCTGDVGLNSSGGFNIPGSRYNNQISISDNQFIDDWGGVGIWQSGARSCENSGEGWPQDAPYCSGGFPNSSNTSNGGQYYFSHIADTQYGGASNAVVQAASSGSTTLLVNGSMATDDQIGIGDPASTTTASTTDVTSLAGSQTINAASTTGFPSSGQLRVGTSAAWSDAGGSYTGAILSYTGTTGTSFTGVSLVRGSGTLAGPILQVQPYKITGETCYANDCALTITPGLSASAAAGAEVSNAGTCQLYATSAATPTSPLAPNGTSYFDGCQWGTKNISITSNNFIFDPTTMAASAPLSGGKTTTSCTADHNNDCGTNFMAYQEAGEPPFSTFIGGNAMYSNSALTSCPSWDSGCSSSPLKNINALSNPPDAPANNGEAANNDVWSDNTYSGPWAWNAYSYGGCDEPSDPTTNKSMPAGACSVDFSDWQTDWQQDAGSTYSASPQPTPTTTATPTVSATPTPSATPSSSPSGTTGDLNNDGQVNIFDLSILLSDWGTNNATADLNHDGTVNVFDLSILLSHWGT